MLKDRPIYLDYAATTPCDGRVVDCMLPFLSEKFGNPNSLHFYGEEARDSLEIAREQVSSLLGSRREEIIFTSGSTEANRIAIRRGRGHRGVVSLSSEHKSIFEACQEIKAVFLGVSHNGLLDHNRLRESLTDDVGLVSVCFVNNETGVIQDIKSISDICHERDVLLHTDATQAFGKIPIDVNELGIDFLSASGHKIYGPKGIGILYCNQGHRKQLEVREANREVEFGIRSGTIPVALCVGLGEASRLASLEMVDNLSRISSLRNRLEGELISQLEELYFNGASGDSSFPGIANISFRGCEGEALMMESSRICVSSGSACTSNKLSISHVLKSMGITPDIAQSSLRISIGKFTSERDVDIAIEDLVRATNKLRDMSPVWRMIKSGADIERVFDGVYRRR